METPFFGELLALFLIFLNCIRIFLLKFGKIDSLTILAPLSVLCVIFQIFAWNLDIFSFFILILSIFCFFTNFRALLRFFNGLYVDHYSVAFRLGSILILICTLFISAVLIIFRPVTLSKNENKIEKQKVRISGDFTGGFEKSGAFCLSNGEIRIFSPLKKELSNRKLIILLSDKRSDSIEYVPYMTLLAEKGFTVYSGDFYARDVKWFRNFMDYKIFRKFSMLVSYFYNPVKFEMQKEFYSFNMEKELNAMLDFVQRYGECNENSVFIIGDQMADICLDDFSKEKNKYVCSILKLSDLPEYLSPGFGFVQQTSPFTAKLLKLERNSDLSSLKNIVEKTVNLIPKEVENYDAE